MNALCNHCKLLSHAHPRLLGHPPRLYPVCIPPAALAALLPTDAPQHPHHYPPTSQQADKSKSWQVGKLASTRAGESSPRLSRLNVPPPPLSFQFITPRLLYPVPRLYSSCERPAALTPCRPPSPGTSAATTSTPCRARLHPAMTAQRKHCKLLSPAHPARPALVDPPPPPRTLAASSFLTTTGGAIAAKRPTTSPPMHPLPSSPFSLTPG